MGGRDGRREGSYADGLAVLRIAGDNKAAMEDQPKRRRKETVVVLCPGERRNLGA